MRCQPALARAEAAILDALHPEFPSIPLGIDRAFRRCRIAAQWPDSGGSDMPDFGTRVTRLEERSDAQTHTMDYLRSDMSDLRRSMDSLSTDLRSEMAALRSEMVTLSTELRGEMATLSADLRSEMATLSTDLRSEMAALRTELRGEMAVLRDSLERRFTWLVGIQVAGLVAVIGALISANFR
jgi:hypothetical protein